MTRIVAVDPARPDFDLIDQAAAIIRSGGLVAFGTETVYGLGADATNPAAVARIFAAKGRPPTNPLIVHAADVDGALGCVRSWPVTAAALGHRFWPGPLTLVLPRAATIPDLVTAGQDTVGVRIPAAPVARALIRRAGVPVAAPSANRSNRISPTLAAHVLKDLDGVVDLILDTGPCAVGIESTVLDLTGATPTILRPGAVTAAEIAATIGQPVASRASSIAADQAATSPGQLAIHYAPQTPAYRVERSALSTFRPDPAVGFGVIALGRWPAGFEPVGWRAARAFDDPAIAAAELYDTFHWLDDLGLAFLVVFTPADDEPGWLAVLDRVRRATRPWTSSRSGPPDQPA